MAPHSQVELPGYLSIPGSELGKGTRVIVRIVGDTQSVAQDMANTIFEEITGAHVHGRGATFIIPVGPVDQFAVLARRVNAARLSLHETMFINMDEYLTDDDELVPESHPLSFRGYMQRAFYGLLDPALAPPAHYRVFPDPRDCGTLQKLIDSRGGVDACFGGIGINGHIAFNEPPEPGITMKNDEFCALPTRVLSLARETRTINSVTVGGEISVVPDRAVTVGMREILASRRLRFYCNRPWQSAVVRRVLHGPITPACPASFLRNHPDAQITVADYVAQPPDIRLR